MSSRVSALWVKQAVVNQTANRWWALLAFALPFLVYYFTVAPTIYWLDSAELTTGAYTLGIVHAPGSPLYLLLGHLFAQLPIGDVGYRLNLMSVCTSALTVLFIYLIIHHLTRQPVLALVSSWFMAFTYYVWVPAVAAELYSLQGCLLVGLLFLALKWREQQHPWQLGALALLFGMGLGNHLSLVLLLPGFALLALSVPLPWRQPRWLLLSVLCGLLGASIYLYLPLRFLADPALNYAGDYWDIDLASWSGFWWMITGRMFDPIFFAVPLQALPGRLFEYGYSLWSNFVGLGAFISLMGLIGDFKNRPIFHLSLLLMLVLHLTFYIPYAAPDQSTMLVPSYLIWGVWFGLGVHTLSERFPWGAIAPGVNLWAALVFILALVNVGLNLKYADKHGDWSARERGEEILAAMAPNSVFFGTWIDVPILEYLQIVEAQRPDVKVVNVLFTSDEEERSLTAEKLAAGIPAYTSLERFLDQFGFEQNYYEDCRCLEMSVPESK